MPINGCQVVPPIDECISELHLDRGFSPQAAKQYLKVFDQTAVVADLAVLINYLIIRSDSRTA